MSSPRRTSSELLAAARSDGWHHDPLGCDIMDELSVRQRLANRPKMLIAGLSVALVACVALAITFYVGSENMRKQVAFSAKSGTVAEQSSGKLLAAAEAAAAAADSKTAMAMASNDALIKAITKANEEAVGRLNDQIASLRTDNERLKREVMRLNLAAEKPDQTKTP